MLLLLTLFSEPAYHALMVGKELEPISRYLWVKAACVRYRAGSTWGDKGPFTPVDNLEVNLVCMSLDSGRSQRTKGTGGSWSLHRSASVGIEPLTAVNQLGCSHACINLVHFNFVFKKILNFLLLCRSWNHPFSLFNSFKLNYFTRILGTSSITMYYTGFTLTILEDIS